MNIWMHSFIYFYFKKIYFYVLCKCVDMCEHICVSVLRDQKVESGIAVLCHFPFTLLRQGLTLDVGLMFSLLG